MPRSIYKYMKIWCFLLLLIVHRSTQDCPEEILEEGVEVVWSQTAQAQNVTSLPKCYVDDDLISRNCNGTHWEPPLANLTFCTNVTKLLNYSIICPPGSFSISKNSSDYCYAIEPKSSWHNPCFNNGAATVITDLTSSNIYNILNVLKIMNISRYFWLPAKRPGFFLKPTWVIPGPNFGVTVQANKVLNITLTLWKNCVALDIDKQTLITETCTQLYPSICLFINALHHPKNCQNGYYSFRFLPNSEKCYGVEFVKDSDNASFHYLRNNKCAVAMGDDDKYKNDLVRFLFHKIASFESLPQDYWCWFGNIENSSNIASNKPLGKNSSLNQVAINSQGTISLWKSTSLLPCIACETDVIYEETQLILEYNELDQLIYLTVYNPSSLWRYVNDDKGIQCFTNVDGPTNIVNINDFPVMSSRNNIEKIIYTIELPRLTPAEYWCVGHTKQFTSINTEKIVINPQASNLHVYSLVFAIGVLSRNNQSETDIITDIVSNLESIFQVENIIFMDVQQRKLYLMVFVHLQSFVLKQKAKDVMDTYEKLKEAAITNLPLYNYTFVNISSATHCLPDFSEDIFTLRWDLTPIGHITTPEEFCLQHNGLPVTRQCNGFYISGSYWGGIIGNCTAGFNPTTTTTYLYNFVSGKLPENYAYRFLTDGLDFVLGDVDIIIPADVYYLAISLEQISQSAEKKNSLFEMTDIHRMSWVMDRIMSLNTNSLRLAQTLNSTNMILDTVDHFIELLSKPLNLALQPRGGKKNYQLAVQPKFMVQISHPHDSNITGIAISRISSSHNFTDMIIQPLFKNTSIDYVMSINNLEIATWIPENLLLSLTKNVSDYNDTQENDLALIITVFYDDSVFQQLEETDCIVNSRIVGVSIPGYYSNFKLPMPLLFKDINVSNSEKRCVFWDFNQHNDHLPGLWSENGCYVITTEKNITICECYHLTHFGNLIINKDYHEHGPSYNSHMNALNIISLVGCFLSLIGLIGIWITALVFQAWRKKPGTKILLHLSVSVAIPLVIFVFFNLDTSIFIEEDNSYYIESSMRVICITLGVLLHYSILASFLWMLITACLQFIRYVRVLGISRPKRFTVKLSLIAWGLPSIPVTIVLLVDKDNYIPSNLSNKNAGLICYPQGTLAVTCVTIPVCVIIVINTLIFIRIIYAISRGPDGKKRKADVDLVYAQMRLSILLFFLLGLTWTFGLFSFSNNYLWSYLFCLTSTMQGLVLFIYFVICDPSTRNLWVMLIKPQFVTTLSRESVTSTSF